MNILIVRSCDRDLQMAQICAETALLHMRLDRVIFLHEGNHKPIITQKFEIIARPFADNFGGDSNVVILRTYMSQISGIGADDTVLFSDSDVIFTGNSIEAFLNADIDHGGLFGAQPLCEGAPHISGQLQIMRGDIWNRWVSDHGGAEAAMQALLRGSCSIADDTALSLWSHRQGTRRKDLSGSHTWIHVKHTDPWVLSMGPSYNKFSSAKDASDFFHKQFGLV